MVKRAAVILLFFLSGAVALVYELIFSRLCAGLFGQTAIVLAFVVAGYLLGLALGSSCLAKRLGRFRSGLAAYGWFSIYSAVGALLAAGAARLLQLLPLPLEPLLLRNIVSALLIIVIVMLPAFFMGGSLPALAQFLGKPSIGALYGWNTWGGVLGILISAFALFPLFGFKQTLIACAGLHVVLGVLAVVLDRSRKPADAWSALAAPDSKASGSPVILAAVFLGGASGLAAEMLWTRALALTIGSTTYAFAVVLAGFLTGIAFGSLLASRLSAKKPALTLFWLGMSQIGVGLVSPLLLAGLNKLPFLYLALHSVTREMPWLLHAGSLLLVLIFLLTVTVLYGACFPLACAAYADNAEEVGRTANWNLTGSVLGALTMPLITIPAVGLNNALYLPVMFSLSGGILVIYVYCGRNAKIAGAVLTAAAAALLFLAPAQRDVIALSGVHTYADRFLTASGGRVDFSAWNRLFRDWDVLFRKDGRHFTVGVLKNRIDDVILTVDGKTDASTSPVDMPTQITLGHLGSLLHPGLPRRAMVIGLGSGISLRAVLAQENIERVWCAEVEPNVVKASEFFRDYGGGVPADPRLKLLVEDARQALLRLREPLDLVISEPSNPWMSGVSHLFTKEFYDLAAARLKEDGLMVQWLHFYLMSPEDFKLAVRTFTSAFPHSSLWWTAASDIILVGSKKPVSIPVDELRRRMQSPLIKKDFSRINLEDPVRLLSHCLLFEEALTAFTGAGGLHTDAHPRLEFTLPGTMFRSDLTARNRMELFSAAQAPLPLLKGKIDQLDLVEACLLESNLTAAEKLLDGYTASHPKDPRAWRLLAQLWTISSQPRNALGPLKMAAGLDPGNSAIFQKLSEVLFRTGEIEESLSAALKAASLDPRSPEYLNQAGLIYRAMKKTDKSREAFTKAYRLDPKNVIAVTSLAATYLDSGQLVQAEKFLRQATEINVNYGPLHYYWGRFFQMRGDFSSARYAFQKAVALDPSLMALLNAAPQQN